MIDKSVLEDHSETANSASIGDTNTSSIYCSSHGYCIFLYLAGRHKPKGFAQLQRIPDEYWVMSSSQIFNHENLRPLFGLGTRGVSLLSVMVERVNEWWGQNVWSYFYCICYNIDLQWEALHPTLLWNCTPVFPQLANGAKCMQSGMISETSSRRCECPHKMLFPSFLLSQARVVPVSPPMWAPALIIHPPKLPRMWQPVKVNHLVFIMSQNACLTPIGSSLPSLSLWNA